MFLVPKIQYGRDRKTVRVKETGSLAKHSKYATPTHITQRIQMSPYYNSNKKTFKECEIEQS